MSNSFWQILEFIAQISSQVKLHLSNYYLQMSLSFAFVGQSIVTLVGRVFREFLSSPHTRSAIPIIPKTNSSNLGAGCVGPTVVGARTEKQETVYSYQQISRSLGLGQQLLGHYHQFPQARATTLESPFC